MENKKHLPMIGVGPVYVVVIIAVTVIAVIKDFEDCFQDRCAEYIRAEYIITRNVKDFEVSTVQAVLPEKFLEITS